jgi:hypothetical protein
MFLPIGTGGQPAPEMLRRDNHTFQAIARLAPGISIAQAQARLTAMGANIDVSGFSDEDRERRFAAYDTEAAAIIAGFTVDGIISTPSSTNVATALA